MLSGRQVSSRQEVGQQPSWQGQWRKETVYSTCEMRDTISGVNAEMVAAGYAENDLFAVHLALEEAIVNAIKHGHRENTTKRVEVRYVVEPDRVLAEVADEGAGFDPDQVPDPCVAANLERPNGRGLLLMRHYMTWVRF